MKFVDFDQVWQGRRDRSQDQKTRSSLGLTYVGLIYVRNDWKAEPKEYFTGYDQTLFVKHGPSDYRPLETEITEGLAGADFAAFIEGLSGK